MKSTITRTHSGAYVANSYYLMNDDDALIIDPAFSFHACERILDGRSPSVILLTHGHFDHFYDCEKFREKFGTKIYIHANDENCLIDKRYSYPTELPDGLVYTFTHADGVFHDGEQITFGDDVLTVIHTPGHSEGSCCFYSNGVFFSGDTLFKGSIGRTDFLFGSDEKKMTKSLSRLMQTIPEKTIIYPGHGFRTTMGEELKYNPFLTAYLH